MTGASHVAPATVFVCRDNFHVSGLFKGLQGGKFRISTFCDHRIRRLRAAWAATRDPAAQQGKHGAAPCEAPMAARVRALQPSGGRRLVERSSRLAAKDMNKGS
jgi:hypothetical protein